MDLLSIKIFLVYLLTLLMVIGFYPHLFSKSYSHWRAIPQFLIVLFTFLAVMGYTFDKMDPDPDTIYGVVFIGTLFILIALLLRSTYLYYVKGYGKRWAGPRKKPFNFTLVVVGGTLLLAGIMYYFVLYHDMQSTYLLRLILLGFGASFFINLDSRFDIKYPDKQEQEEYAQVIAEQKNVLFIRSFKSEKRPFWCGWYLSSPKKLDSINAGLIISFPFMDYFGTAFEDHFFPLVGLGNPVDTIPGEGVLISYEQDGNWQDALLHHLDHSAAVVMSVGQSTNLSWELEKIKAKGMLSKFFIFTQPEQSSFWNKLHLVFLGLNRAVPSWGQFKTELSSMGYMLPEQEPPAGSIIRFDENGKGSILKSGLRGPEEYVLTLKKGVRGQGTAIDS